MDKFDESDARMLIKTALESGSMKLNGPPTDGKVESAKRMAEADAVYLVKLLERLQEPAP